MAITKAGVASGIPVIIAQEALGLLANNAVMASRVRRDFEDEVATMGDTVKIPIRGALTVNDKVANSGVTVQSPTDSNVQIVLNKHKEITFTIEDVARAEARPDYMMGYAQDAATALSEQVDIDLLTLVQSVAAGNRVGTAGTNVTSATVRAARLKGNTLKMPIDGRVLVVSPKDEDSLLGDTGIQNAYAFGENVQQDAQLRRLWGFTPLMSQLVTATGVSPTTTWNVAFHQLGIALVTRPLPLAPADMGIRQYVVNKNGVGLRVTVSYDTNLLGLKVTFDVLYGVQVVRPEFVVPVLG